MQKRMLALLVCAGCREAARDEAGGVVAAAPAPATTLAFVDNRGQWPTDARLVARTGAATVALRPGSFDLQLQEREGARGVLLRFVLEGGRPACEPQGEGLRQELRHFFLGNDPARWRSRVTAWTRAAYRAYPGVELVLHDGRGALEYDLLLAPGADLARVNLRCEGAQQVLIAEDGALVMATELGPVRQKPPVAWQSRPDGTRVPVPSRFVLRAPATFGFAVAAHDPGLPLCIDPQFEWSTLLGGSSSEFAGFSNGSKLAANGDVLVAGTSPSPDFPTTPGAYARTARGADDVVVTRLRADGGALVWSTYLGGSGIDYAVPLALDAAEAVWVGGFTASSGFPTTLGAFDRVHDGGSSFRNFDAFLARLSADGSQLLYSTFLGGPASGSGTGDDWVWALAVDGQGRAVVGGYSGSPMFPTTGGVFQARFGGGPSDCFAAIVSPSGAGSADLVWSTFLGGSGDEGLFDLALDPAGTITVVGATYSRDFPASTGAYQAIHRGGTADAIVARLDPRRNGAAQLVWSSFLGGTGYDGATAVAVDRDGEVVVGGTTRRLSWPQPPAHDLQDFPTTPGAFRTDYVFGETDAFVTRLLADGRALRWSTLLGGSLRDDVTDLALDSAGNVTWTGVTLWRDFPTTPGSGAILPLPALLFYQAVAGRLAADGSELLFSTMFGDPAGIEDAENVLLTETGSAVVVGATSSINFPTTPGAFSQGPPVGMDLFVSRLSMLPDGVTRYGSGTPACNGPVWVGTRNHPDPGGALFWVTCTGAPPSARGYLLIAAAPDRAGTLFAGIRLHVAPGRFFFAVPVAANTRGFAEVPLPVIGLPRATQLWLQFVWSNPAGCGAGSFSASNAVEVTVQ